MADGGNKGYAGNVFNAWAAATIAGAALTNAGGMGALLTRTGVGVYVFTLTGALAMSAQRYSLVIGPAHAATAWCYDVVDTSNTVKTISFFTPTNLAALEMISFTVGAVFLPL